MKSQAVHPSNTCINTSITTQPEEPSRADYPSPYYNNRIDHPVHLLIIEELFMHDLGRIISIARGPQPWPRIS